MLRVVRDQCQYVWQTGHVDDEIHISALDVFYEMDGRERRYIKEVLDWYEKKMLEISGAID